MKSVVIPCCLVEEGDDTRIKIVRDSSTLDIWSYEGDSRNLVCLDREGVKKLIAAAQEWLEKTK